MNSLKTFAFFTVVACGEKEEVVEAQEDNQKIEVPEENTEVDQVEEPSQNDEEPGQNDNEEAAEVDATKGKFEKTINRLGDNSNTKVTTETFETKE